MNYVIETKYVGKSYGKRLECDFFPYENLVADWHTDYSHWKFTGILGMAESRSKPVVLENNISFYPQPIPGSPEYSMRTVYKGEPNTEYHLSMRVRVNGAEVVRMSSGDLYDYTFNKYVKTLQLRVESDDEGNIPIEVKFFGNIILGALAWIGAFQIVKIPDELKELTTDYIGKFLKYTSVRKESPLLRDMFDPKEDPSPYIYALYRNGEPLSLDKTVEELGIKPTDDITITNAVLGEAIYKTFVNDIRLMSMLEGDRLHVSHMFPKEKREMAQEAPTNFPRVQFYTGFEVGAMSTDTTPFAVSINYAIRFYLPFSKVLPSVDSQLLMGEINRLMRDLKWTSIRGSDFSLKQEQLYVLEVQYIKDIAIQQED